MTLLQEPTNKKRTFTAQHQRRRRSQKRITLLLASGLMLTCLMAEQLRASAVPWVDSLLSASWSFYKTNHMVNNERVKSQYFGGTISEGQSYALGKALTLNDQATFDKVIKWTTANMKRPTDNLIGWHWTTSGLVGKNNATDADEDIAYYLLLAAEKWNRPEYANQAKAIINDIWRINVRTIAGKLYIDPGTSPVFRQSSYLVLNPSYFAPYIYRKFAQVDPSHNWNGLANNIYPTLEACSNLTTTKLPPNWCSVNYSSGQIGFADSQGRASRDFGWDAVRVFWRMAWDASLGSSQAVTYLRNHNYLLNYLSRNGRLPAGFTATGGQYDSGNNANTLSAAVAQSNILNPSGIQTFYNNSLGKLYNNQGYWQNGGNNFLQDIVWFGMKTLNPPQGSSPTPTPTPGLPAPANLTGSPTLDSKPFYAVRVGTLRWEDRASNETGYEVWWSALPDRNFSLLQTLGTNATTWTDRIGRSPMSEDYYYKVRAVNSNGPSDFSNTVRIGKF